MKAKFPIFAIASVIFLAAVQLTDAQQTTKGTPIGYLSGSSLSANAARREAFHRTS